MLLLDGGDVDMLKKLKRRTNIKEQVSFERRKLLEGVHLAMVQWQFGHEDENRNGVMMDLLERRYMFLYEIAKKRKIHVLE